MGNWGYGIFENDNAMDLVDESYASNTVDPILHTIDQILESRDNPIDMDFLKFKGVTAAACVLIADGYEFEDLERDYVAWLRGQPGLLGHDVALKALRATKAVNRYLVEQVEELDWQDDDAMKVYLSLVDLMMDELETLSSNS